MTTLSDFLGRCDALASRLGVTESTLSTKLFGDGKRLSQIRRGGDVGLRRLERVQPLLVALEQGAHDAVTESEGDAH